MALFKNFLKIVFFCLGLLLFWNVLSTVDIREFQNMRSVFFGPGVLIFFLYPLICIWDVWAWQLVFHSSVRAQAKMTALFWIRLAGEAVNNVTPLVDIGGEPVKVLLVHRKLGIPKNEALSSVIVGRTAIFTAEIIFGIFGIFLSIVLLDLPREWKLGLWSALAAMVCIMLIAMSLQIKMHTVTAVFYEQQSADFAKAVLLHTIGWIAGGVEMWLMFGALGHSITLTQGLMLESLLQLIRLASFFIPANLGTQEAGLAFLAGLLAMNPAVGVAVSFLKRIRQILWTSLGFVSWGVLQK